MAVGENDEVLREKKRNIKVDQLPDTVVRLTSTNDCQVFIVGTAHFSKTSQREVSELISMVQPDAVVLELCRSRSEIILVDDDLNKNYDISFASLYNSMKNLGVFAGALRIFFLIISIRLSRQLGMTPGGEFRAAYKAANEVPGCSILFGDRPIQITLKRTYNALSAWQKLKFFFNLMFTNTDITLEDVEKYKDRDILQSIIIEISNEHPQLTTVLINERDVYLSAFIKQISNNRFNDRVFKYVVAVVGIGHVQGIVENWNKNHSIDDIKKICRVPSKSPYTALFYKGLKYSSQIFGLYLTYRLLRRVHIL